MLHVQIPSLRIRPQLLTIGITFTSNKFFAQSVVDVDINIYLKIQDIYSTTTENL